MVLRCCSNSARESGMGLILLKDSASNPEVLISTDYKPKKRNLTHIHSYVAHPGKPHCLRLIEFGVLESPKAKQPVQYRGRKILLFDIQKVAANNLDLHRKGARYWTLCSLSGWWQRPRVLSLIFRRTDSHSDKVSTSLQVQVVRGNLL